MAVIATEHAFPTDVFKHEYEGASNYCREVVTYNGAVKSFAVGTLVKADGAAPANAGEIFGVVRFPVDAALNTDTDVVVVKRGPAAVRAAGLILGGLDAALVAAALEAKGIEVLAD